MNTIRSYSSRYSSSSYTGMAAAAFAGTGGLKIKVVGIKTY